MIYDQGKLTCGWSTLLTTSYFLTSNHKPPLRHFLHVNKLKSLKVAQVKDEMDDDEEDGCDFVW